MSTLEELAIKDDETLIEVPEDLPEEGGGYVPLVQPGKYVLKLPDDLSAVWTKFESSVKGTRVSAFFSKESPLIVVEDGEFAGEFKNSPVQTFVNNLEYRRGREGVEVADMTYLIQALEANLPETDRSKLTSNGAFVKALQRHEGKVFKCEVSWTAYCNPNKNIWAYMEDDAGVGRTEEMEGTPGCSRNYNTWSRNPYEKIPKGDDKYFVERFDEFDVHGDPDECPARLRANIRLGRFAPFVK